MPYKYNDCQDTRQQSPKLGDFSFEPLSGVMYYFGRDGYWHDNIITECNGDEFDIIRLEQVKSIKLENPTK